MIGAQDLHEAGAARLFAAALAIIVAAILVALAVYSRAVDKDIADDGEQTSPIVAETVNSRAEAETLVRRVSAHLEKQPRDARAWAILARLQFEMDHFTEAAHAYARALELPSRVASDPAVWCEYADALGMTQGGSLAGRPRELINRALALNPDHPKALEMAGSAQYALGDYAAALRFWRPLLALLLPGSRVHAELASAIARAERLAMLTIPLPMQ